MRGARLRNARTHVWMMLTLLPHPVQLQARKALNLFWWMTRPLSRVFWPPCVYLKTLPPYFTTPPPKALHRNRFKAYPMRCGTGGHTMAPHWQQPSRSQNSKKERSTAGKTDPLGHDGTQQAEAPETSISLLHDALSARPSGLSASKLFTFIGRHLRPAGAGGPPQPTLGGGAIGVTNRFESHRIIRTSPKAAGLCCSQWCPSSPPQGQRNR